MSIFRPGIGFYIKDKSRQKVETWNKSIKIYNVGNQKRVKGLSSETGIIPDYPVEPTIEDVLAGLDAATYAYLRTIIKRKDRNQT